MFAVALLAICTPLPTCTPQLQTNCATPTPTVRWTAPNPPDLAGHALYVCADVTGGGCTLLATIPCTWADLDEDDVDDTRVCPGADTHLPIQRYGNFPANTTQRFRIAAYDTSGNVSALSSSITICMPPIWTKPEPYQ